MSVRSVVIDLLWADRIGGGYSTREEAMLAAELLEFPVLVGPCETGLFIIVHDRST